MVFAKALGKVAGESFWLCLDLIADAMFFFFLFHSSLEIAFVTAYCLQ